MVGKLLVKIVKVEIILIHSFMIRIFFCDLSFSIISLYQQNHHGLGLVVKRRHSRIEMAKGSKGSIHVGHLPRN